MPKNKNQTFNDGIVHIYSVGNIAPAGNMPKDGLTLKQGPLRYEERIVGMSRFWTAMQAQVQVDMVIRTPQIKTVSTQDVAVLHDGSQYRIKQVQYPKEIEPAVMDLSLERLVQDYEFE